MSIENKTEAQAPEVKSDTTSQPEEMVTRAEFDKLSNEIQLLKVAKMDELVGLLYKQAQDTPAPKIPDPEKTAADYYREWKESRKNRKGGQ